MMRNVSTTIISCQVPGNQNIICSLIFFEDFPFLIVMKNPHLCIRIFPKIVYAMIYGVMMAFFLLILPEVQAHPHVFVVQRLNAIFDNNGLAGINVCWEFDEMFAAMITEDHDCNRNGKLEPPEIATIKEKAFSYIKEFSFFHFIKIDKKSFRVNYIKNFKAVMDDKKIIYEFFIPCHVPATNHFKKISIATYDPTYYTAIFFTEKNPFSITSAEAFEVKASVREDPETKIYFGMVHPWALFLDFRWKQ